MTIVKIECEYRSIDEIIDLHSVPWDDFTNMECLIETLYDHQVKISQ